MAGPEDAGLRLLGGTDALERWKQSLDRFWLSRGSVCAPLDVADRKASIPPTGSPTRSSVALRGSASASQAFDGSPVQQASKQATPGSSSENASSFKLRHCAHERLQTTLNLEHLRNATGIPAPRLLDNRHRPSRRRVGHP